jgi:hypothetical protein
MSQNQQGVLGRFAGRLTGRALDVVDPQVVLDHIDIEAVLDRIDVNRVLDRIDANRLLDRVDIDRVLARIDMDKLLAGVDLEALVRRSGVPDIVAESTGRVAGSALDVARRQLAGLDTIVDRLVDRLLRRPLDARPVAPPLLQGIDA